MASESVVKGIAPVEAIQQFVDTFLPIVAEARIHFDEDGVHARAVDPANVAMAFVDLDVAAFESYEAPGRATVGVNLEALDERLSIANSGDLVGLSIDMETRMLQVEIRNVDQEVALIDPETIRSEPDDVELDLPNSVTLEGDALDEAITVADIVSDHIKIEGEPDEKRVLLEAQGDRDSSTVELDRDDVVDASVTEAVHSLISLDYLGDLVKPIPDDSEAEIRFGDEFPLELYWEAVDGHCTVEERVAPRIQSG